MWIILPGVAQHGCSGGNSLVEKVDKNTYGNVFSVNTSCYGVTLEKRVDLLKKPSKNMEEIDVHTWIQCKLRCEQYNKTNIWDRLKPETMVASRVYRVPKQTNSTQSKPF